MGNAENPARSEVDLRNDFLMKLYENSWSNISTAEDTAWKMMAAYTALFAGLSIAIPYITLFGFVSVIIIFSFLSVAIALNANLWFVRNIGISSSIEKEMLLDSDMNKIIPKRWVERKPPFFSWERIEVWWVFIPVFVAVPLITMLVSYCSLNESQRLGSLTVLSRCSSSDFLNSISNCLLSCLSSKTDLITSQVAP
jgi:hypothetical protein